MHLNLKDASPQGRQLKHLVPNKLGHYLGSILMVQSLLMMTNTSNFNAHLSINVFSNNYVNTTQGQAKDNYTFPKSKKYTHCRPSWKADLLTSDQQYENVFKIESDRSEPELGPSSHSQINTLIIIITTLSYPWNLQTSESAETLQGCQPSQHRASLRVLKNYTS